MNFRPYQTTDKASTLNLILSIQQDEFRVAITAEDQPDLHNISDFYQSGTGNFWVATHDEKVIGTIALLDIGHQQVALRKMFVAKAFRGSGHNQKSVGQNKGVAQSLLDQCHQWAADQGVTDIYLGTIDIYRAAMRFYEKNGYRQINKSALPIKFPLIAVDNVFYHRPM